MGSPIILLHGGAGSWKASRERVEKALKDIRDACEHGWRFLRTSSAVEAVVEAVAYMEDSGSFNAGVGSVLNLAGYRELDAGVMDGSSLRFGAVAAVRYTRSPVRLAYIVLKETDHVLLAGEGADKLAKARGLPKLGEPSRDLLERYREVMEKYLRGEWRVFQGNIAVARLLGLMDTVGAVALDSDGRLASAVSTGGVWLKLPGRVGDSPLPGAGFYADANVAIAATGIGEVIAQSLPGIRVALLVGQGYGLEQSMRAVVDWVTARWGRDNTGLIGVDRAGRYSIAFNTKHIMVSMMRSGESFSKLLAREE